MAPSPPELAERLKYIHRLSIIVWLCRLSMLGEGILMATIAATITDNDLIQIVNWDAAPIYILVSALSFIGVLGQRARGVWIIAFSVVTLGRGMGLLILGTPDLPRWSEVRGFLIWLLLWLQGILVVVSLEGAEHFKKTINDEDWIQ